MTRAERYVNLVAFGLMILVNAMASLLPLNGRTTGEISELYPVLITPSGYVFAIWGLIYLLLAGFLAYTFLRPEDPRLNGFHYLFALSCLLNSAWLFAWHWENMSLALTIMLALLATLMFIYANVNYSDRWRSLLAFWLLKLPFSIYLGWISVATIVNVSVTLYAAGWTGWGISPPVWAAIMVLIAAVLALLAVDLRNDRAFALVIIWALTGVGARNSDNLFVAVVAWGAAVGLLVFLGWQIAGDRERRIVR